MPIVEHEKDGQTKYYLEVIFLKAGDAFYELDGVRTPAKAIIGLPQRDIADEGEQGGLDNKVFIRTFAADSITELRVDGQVFV